MDSLALMESVRVAIVGMGLVFLILSLLLVAILLLGRIFPDKHTEAENEDLPPAASGPSNAAARAAAIGVALALHARTGIAPALRAPAGAPAPSTWLDQGRRRQMSRRQMP